MTAGAWLAFLYDHVAQLIKTQLPFLPLKADIAIRGLDCCCYCFGSLLGDFLSDCVDAAAVRHQTVGQDIWR